MSRGDAVRERAGEEDPRAPRLAAGRKLKDLRETGGRARLPLVTLVCLLCLAEAAVASAVEEAKGPLARGDAAWAERADGHRGLEARSAPIERAISSYREAWRGGEGPLEAGWKLVRAHWFAGEFAADGESAQRARFEEATAVAERVFERLAGRASGGKELDELPAEDFPKAFAASERETAARVVFWSAIAWGAWSRTHGLLAVVREGVAGRLHRRARASVALDPTVDGAGPQRLLSRLHATLPRVPFVSGWVDRSQALPWAERAYEIAPDHPANRLILAQAILETGPEDRRPEAIRLLEQVVSLEPRPEAVLEDLATRKSAREHLAEREGG